LRIEGLPDFYGTAYQNGKNEPNNNKIYQMTVKYTKNFNSKAFQKIPNFGLFFGRFTGSAAVLVDKASHDRSGGHAHAHENAAHPRHGRPVMVTRI
jgi:hypothetical protein